MKTKILPTLFLIIMGLTSISAVGTTTEAEPVRMRIESTEISEDLERAIEEQFYEEKEWTPKEGEEIRTESTAYYPHDYSQKTLETVGYQGTSIALDDASIWIPKPNEGYRVQRWPDCSTYQNTGIAPTKVYVTTNESWFYHRNYKFVMVNRETGENVPVMMTHGPRIDRMIQIAKIYHDVGKIELTDQHGNYVVMTIDGWDRNISSYWKEGQRIFIGRNARWSYYNSQYILINLDSNMIHVRAAM